MKYRLFVCIFCFNSSFFLYNLVVICSKINSKIVAAAVIGGEADSMKRIILEKMTNEMMEDMSENHVNFMSSEKRVEVPLVAKDNTAHTTAIERKRMQRKQKRLKIEQWTNTNSENKKKNRRKKKIKRKRNEREMQEVVDYSKTNGLNKRKRQKRSRRRKRKTSRKAEETNIAIFSQNLNEFCGRFLTSRSYTSRSSSSSSSTNNIKKNATNSIWRACSFKPADDVFEIAAPTPRPNVTLHLRTKWLHYMDNLAVYVCYVDGEGVKTGRELSLLQPRISGQSAIVEHSNWSIYDVNALLPLDDHIYDLNLMVFAFVYRITDSRQLSTILLPRLYISYYEDALKKLKNTVYANYCQSPPTFSAAPSSFIPPIRQRGCCLENVRLNLTEEKWSKMIHYPQTLNITVCRAYDELDGVTARGDATSRVPAQLLNECCETHQYKPFTQLPNLSANPFDTAVETFTRTLLIITLSSRAINKHHNKMMR
uniref:Uncharacterized protein n=1 Tax=Romanomermis culicivorax TaxID=13658 RepID=A0A915HNP9_ROMCU